MSLESAHNNYCSDDPRIQDIVIDIKYAIDDLSNQYKKFKDLILELANRLDKEGICEPNAISQVIKEILKDKIELRKITAKWIEECLPTEYKRKYSTKSEQSSLCKKVSITGEGKSMMIYETNPNSNIKNAVGYPKNDIIDNQIYELQEALRKQPQFVSGDQIFSEETLFLIPEEKFQLIKESIEKSNKVCYLKFDKNKILKEIHSDSFSIPK